ncbi:hypothetical protein [Amycolatopsis sp. 195334CR]|uniref:hypothetical protein n=1 Tax=Amycolatopsis sp. 195334CR TaxID=2814588 RepID=UPI001A8DAFF8|nr:hypothetical protein [Amycolatopsis sp. 195334CR]MBN6039490.1 hypothetical protein [Amycolatopsis sp. 195334CR]
MRGKWLWPAPVLLLATGCANAAKPVTASVLDQLTPNIWCDNGDSGYGMDNDRPWHEVTFTLPLVPDPEPVLRDAAARVGFRLEPVDPNPYRVQNAFQDPGHPGLSKLAAHDGARELSVYFARTGVARITCQGGTSHPRNVPPGEVVVLLSVSMPSTLQA